MHEGYSVGSAPAQYLISQYSIAASGQLSPLSPQTVSAGFEGNWITLDPAGNYAYVLQGYCISGLSIGTVAQYKVNTDGTLTPGTVTIPSSCSIAFDPSGKYVYSGSPRGIGGTSQIAQYTTQPDGTLLGAGVISVTGGTAPVFSSNGSDAYTADEAGGTVSQFSVGPTGALSALTPNSVQSGVGPLQQPDALVVHPSNRFVYSANLGDGSISQFAVNADGTLQQLNPPNVATGGGTDSIAVDPTGKFLYAVSGVNGKIVQFSIGTDGKLTPLFPAAVSAGNGAHYLAIDPSGKYLYVTNATDGTISQFSIEATGVLTPLSPATVSDSPGPTEILTAAFHQ